MKDAFAIKNCTILTVDGQDRVYEAGAMIVADGRIRWIGPEEELEGQGWLEGKAGQAGQEPLEGNAGQERQERLDDKAGQEPGPDSGTVIAKDRIIDLKGHLVLPGLVNTHTHSHSSVFRNLGDDMELMDWLNHAMWPAEKHLNPQIAYNAARMTCLEFIRSGITTYADQFYFAEDVARAASESGLNCYLAASVFDWSTAEGGDSFEKAADFVKHWHGRAGGTRVTPCIGPHAPYSVSGDLFKKVVDLADSYDLLIHTHISETEDENAQIMERYGLSPVKWLESLGVFGQKVLAAHCIHLSEEDMDVFRTYNVHVSYNPVSNLKLVSGIMPMKAMKERGIQISIGTDGAQSNNSLDLLRDLRTGSLIQKMLLHNAEFLPAREAVRMATIEGARALGCEGDRGSLEIGKKADFIVMDTTSPRLVPLIRNRADKLYAALVYSALGADVCGMCVDGRWVMRERRVISMDAEDVMAQAQESGRYLGERAGLI